MASLLRRRPITTLCSMFFCRQQSRRYRFCSRFHRKVANVIFDDGGQTTSIETGKLALLSSGSAVINTGGTQVLSAVNANRNDHSLGFWPIEVGYEEKHTPFPLRMEAQMEREFLCSKLIERSISPLFPAGFYAEVQVTATVLSSDGMYDPVVMAANATSAALMLSDIPWNGPIGVVRVGRIDGKFIFNPTMDELSCSDVNLVYACTKDKTLMIDGHGWEIKEEDLQTGLKLSHSEALKYIGPQIRLAEEAGRKKGVFKLSIVSDRTLQKIRSIAEGPTATVLNNSTNEKGGQLEALDNITQTVQDELAEECDEESFNILQKAAYMVLNEIICRRIIDQGLRVDGRQLDELGPLLSKSGIYGMMPGSSYFFRGDTKVKCTVTLETPGYTRQLDWIVGPPRKRLMHDFRVTPIPIYIYTSDEERVYGGRDVREVARGTLAEKALLAVLPPEDDFPYHIFVNYEIFGSDGSTSMATVCAGSMALMDAGVPIREYVAGVSVGLVSDVDPSGRITGYRILTDLSDFEDHHGDVNFRIAGTRKGITAIQLDIKPAGIPLDVICECLEPAQKGRNQILDHMEEKNRYSSHIGRPL